MPYSNNATPLRNKSRPATKNSQSATSTLSTDWMGRIEKLEDSLQVLKLENSSLKDNNANLITNLHQKDDVITDKDSKITSLQAEISTQREMIKKLEKKSNIDKRNLKHYPDEKLKDSLVTWANKLFFNYSIYLLMSRYILKL